MTQEPKNIASRAAGWNPDLYDSKHAFVWRYGEEVVSLLEPRPAEHILDLGCGTGHLAAQIAALGALVTGVDRSPEMIQAAKKEYPQLQFEVADARNLPFHNEFDAVFSNATLHWIHEAAQVIQAVGCALKPHGRFVAELGGKGNIRRMQDAFDQALAEIAGGEAEKINPWYYPSISEYSALLENNGFEVAFITLFDRPTVLADGEAGMRNWITMFGSPYLKNLEAQSRERFLTRAEELLRSDAFREGQWVADYRRMRLVAWKQPDGARE